MLYSIICFSLTEKALLRRKKLNMFSWLSYMKDEPVPYIGVHHSRVFPRNYISALYHTLTWPSCVNLGRSRASHATSQRLRYRPNRLGQNIKYSCFEWYTLNSNCIRRTWLVVNELSFLLSHQTDESFWVIGGVGQLFRASAGIVERLFLASVKFARNFVMYWGEDWIPPSPWNLRNIVFFDL